MRSCSPGDARQLFASIFAIYVAIEGIRQRKKESEEVADLKTKIENQDAIILTLTCKVAHARARAFEIKCGADIRLAIAPLEARLDQLADPRARAPEAEAINAVAFQDVLARLRKLEDPDSRVPPIPERSLRRRALSSIAEYITSFQIYTLAAVLKSSVRFSKNNFGHLVGSGSSFILSYSSFILLSFFSHFSLSLITFLKDRGFKPSVRSYKSSFSLLVGQPWVCIPKLYHSRDPYDRRTLHRSVRVIPYHTRCLQSINRPVARIFEVQHQPVAKIHLQPREIPHQPAHHVKREYPSHPHQMTDHFIVQRDPHCHIHGGRRTVETNSSLPHSQSR